MKILKKFNEKFDWNKTGNEPEEGRYDDKSVEEIAKEIFEDLTDKDPMEFYIGIYSDLYDFKIKKAKELDNYYSEMAEEMAPELLKFVQRVDFTDEVYEKYQDNVVIHIETGYTFYLNPEEHKMSMDDLKDSLNAKGKEELENELYFFE